MRLQSSRFIQLNPFRINHFPTKQSDSFDMDNTVLRIVDSHTPSGGDNRVPTIACHSNTILSGAYEALLPSNVSVPQSRQT